MPIPIVDGPYGGCSLALFSILLSVLIVLTAQDLMRSGGLSTAQVLFTKTAISSVLIAIYAAFKRPAIFKQLDVRSQPRTISNWPGYPSSVPAEDQESIPLLTDTSIHDSSDWDGNRARLIWTRSCILTIGMLCSYASLQFASISDITAISQTLFFVVALLCWIIYRQVPTWRTCVAGFVSFGAVLCIIQPASLFSTGHVEHGSGQAAIGYYLALINTVLQAIDFMIVKKIGKEASILATLLSYEFVTACLCLSYMCVNQVRPVGLSDIIIWLKLAVLTTGTFISGSCWLTAINRESATRISLLAYMQVVFALLLQVIILGDIPGGLKIGAMGVIVIAGIWTTIADKSAENVTITD